MRPKNLIFPLLACTLLCAYPLSARASLDSSPSIVIDGAKLSPDVPAALSGDYVLVPLRGVLEQFGASVSYDEASGTATASLNGTDVVVTVGSRQAKVNGEPRAMDIAAREVAGRVMVPLRFVAQALGVSVDYDAQTNTVIIVSGRRPGSFAAYAGGPVFSRASRTAPTVQDERPGSNEIVGSQYPSIYARLGGGTSAVNPSTVQIQVDGIDVTASATISSAYVSYTPAAPLQTGLHNVYITGQADDGTPFTESWSFRVDAGESSDYTAGSYGGGGFGFAGSGFGWPWFHRFHFFPPGFSVFTPGSLFFVSGGLVEVIFVSRFFPFGNAFFTISGCPGTFALTPWLGNPGFFWGFMQVPFGVHAHNAVIAAHFTMPDGRSVVVHSTAPMQIEGTRTSLPADLRYAVEPRLIGKPKSPHQLVVFRRVEPRAETSRPAPFVARPASMPQLRASGGFGNRAQPIVTHPPAAIAHPAPVLRPAPVARAPVLQPHNPATMPVMRGPGVSPWQIIAPARPAMPVMHVPVRPK